MITILLSLLVALPEVWSCGQVVELEAGKKFTFTSPNYPNKFPAITTCKWKITTTSPNGFQLNCPSIDIKPNMKCFFGKIIISSSSTNLNFCDKNSLSTHINSNNFEFKFNSRLVMNRKYTGFSCTVSLKADEGPCNCGIKDKSRIVGGTNAEMHEYPWQAMIRKMVNKRFHCGAVLITRNFVLTAYHCVEKFSRYDIFVTLGDHIRNKPHETDKTVHIKVAEIMKHERYNTQNSNNDIALLRLEVPATLNSAISPACLPYGFENDNIAGEKGIVTGWGAIKDGGPNSESLKEVELPILNTGQCMKYFPSKLTDNMFCTYKSGEDACYGDSGGPLVINKNNKYYLFGIVSWGKDCAVENSPGVYAKVTKYLKWIEEKTNTTFCKA